MNKIGWAKLKKQEEKTFPYSGDRKRIYTIFANMKLNIME